VSKLAEELEDAARELANEAEGDAAAYERGYGHRGGRQQALSDLQPLLARVAAHEAIVDAALEQVDVHGICGFCCYQKVHEEHCPLLGLQVEKT